MSNLKIPYLHIFYNLPFFKTCDSFERVWVTKYVTYINRANKLKFFTYFSGLPGVPIQTHVSPVTIQFYNCQLTGFYNPDSLEKDYYYRKSKNFSKTFPHAITGKKGL